MSRVSCQQCGGEAYDNRAKKADDPEWQNSPDFVCKDKQGCGWKANWDEGQRAFVEPPRAPARRGAPPSRGGGRPAGPSAPPRPPAPRLGWTDLQVMMAHSVRTALKVWPEGTPLEVVGATAHTLFIAAKEVGAVPTPSVQTPKAAPPPPAAPPPAMAKAPRGFGEVPEALDDDPADDLPF